MARCHLILALLALSVVAAVQGRVIVEGSSSSRSLQQFQASAFCADGCDLANNGCIQDATRGGLRCQKCLGDLMVNKVTGNCACPAGKFASPDGASFKCSDCPKGFFCLGSDFFLADNVNSPIAGSGLLAPQPTQCPTGADGTNMTTLGRRSTSNRACVNQPGTFYTISTAANGLTTVSQETCPVNTYGAGLKKQRACVPCPTGYTTNGATGQRSPVACVVPAGYFLKGPGQVAQCPKGEYKEGTGTVGNCTKCAFGVTTLRDASTSLSNCTQVVEGYYASAMAGSVVTATKPCPQKYYCPGGTPTRVFTPATPNPDAAGSTGTIFVCPKGTWTMDVASTALEQCMTPPGYFTDATTTTKCASGSYRADWKPNTDITACTSCGAGVKAVATDRVVLFNVLDAANQTSEAITTSSDDCYIMPGQGLYFTTLTNSWRAKNCTDNEYGVANITYGLTPASCKECPRNMVTARSAPNTTFPTSAAFYVSNGDTQGFVDEMACVTQDGFGMNGRGAQACPRGTYNSRDNYEDCKSCGYGLTTEGVGRGFTLASCGVAKGFGSYDGMMQPCPIGTYNDVEWNTTVGPCKTCPDGLTTAVEGAQAVGQCNMCQGGRGGENCAGTCGGTEASYGPIGRSVDTNPNCTMCTTQDTGFSFDWNLQNDIYASPAVSRALANQSTDCVSKYSQLQDGAWYIQMAANDQYTKTVANVTTFADCAALCTKSVSVTFYASPVECEFVTYNYNDRTCAIRTAVPPTYVGAPLIAFKNLPSGDVGINAWSVDQQEKAKALGVTTGVYTFYREEGALSVGTQTAPEAIAGAGLSAVPAGNTTQELQNCLNRCDDYRLCAGITITMNVAVADRPTTCKLILGNTQVGTFRRTVMRADPERMPLPSMIDLPGGTQAQAGH